MTRPSSAILEALRALAAAIPTLGTPTMLIGGFAAISHGVPRTTRDIDLAVKGGVVPIGDLLSRFESEGFEARIDDPIAFASESQVLLLRHETSGVEVDVSLAWLSFELEALAAAELVSLAGARIPTVRAEDLVIYKALAWRPRDRDDVESLLVGHGGEMDLDRVRSVVRELSEALGDPSRHAELEAVIERARNE